MAPCSRFPSFSRPRPRQPTPAKQANHSLPDVEAFRFFTVPDVALRVALRAQGGGLYCSEQVSRLGTTLAPPECLLVGETEDGANAASGAVALGEWHGIVVLGAGT